MQAFTSTISTTMVLVLLGVVILTMLTARVLADSVKEDITVTVVLDDGTPENDARRLHNKLVRKPYTKSIEYITPEQALKEQVESMGMDPTDMMGENPFSISMELKMKADYSCNDSLLWITSELKGTKSVADVIYQKDLVDSLNSTLTRISLILLAIALLLVVISLVLINNTVRLSVYSHRVVIHTMKLVGARWSLIRRPFLVTAMCIGVLSALLADGIIYGIICAAENYDNTLSRYLTMQNYALTTGVLLITGLTITVLCTFISVTHALKLREGELY